MRLFLLAILFFVEAHAETTIGNGGDLVVCKDEKGKIFHTQLLDYSEGETLLKKQIKLGDSAWNFEKKVIYALDRLGSVDLGRANRYKVEFAHMLDQILFVYNQKLIDIDDSYHVLVPVGCEVEQLAIHDPTFIENKSYIINGDLWMIMSEDDKAGLILHELIYNETRTHNHTNSRTARYFNYYISSELISGASPETYVKTLEKSFSPRAARDYWPIFPCDKINKTQVLFIFDKSGSNLNTDPYGKTRFESALQLMQSAKVQSCEFAVATISYNSKEIVSGSNTNIVRAIEKMRSTPDDGNTPYMPTFEQLRNWINLKIKEDKDRFIVFFISDGYPTDGFNYTDAVDFALEMHAKPIGLRFHTIDYSEQSNDDNLMLQHLSDSMYGRYLRVASGTSVDLMTLLQ